MLSSTLPSFSSSSSSSSTTNVVFRLSGVNLFLTYPQCSILPKDAEAALSKKLKHYEWSIWGSELHEDGSPHLHALVHLRKPCDFRTSTCLDLLTSGGVVSHGNYQVARDPAAVLDYVIKGGKMECFNVALADARALFTSAGRKRNATEMIMQELEAGKDITTVAFENPEHMTFIMLHKDKLESFYAHRILAQHRPILTFAKAQPKSQEVMPWDSQICQWLNQNIGQTRPFSQKQLWVHGPTKHGKTTLYLELCKMCRTYTVPKEDFYDDYKDSLYDLIVFDEYCPSECKKISWLNQFVDGSPCPLRIKGKQTVKKSNLPVIVFSNYSLRQIYSKVNDTIYATIERRFTEIALGAPLEVALIAAEPPPTDLSSAIIIE